MQETAGLKVGVSSRINEWLTKSPDGNKSPAPKPSVSSLGRYEFLRSYNLHIRIKEQLAHLPRRDGFPVLCCCCWVDHCWVAHWWVCTLVGGTLVGGTLVGGHTGGGTLVGGTLLGGHTGG